jgi:hypothetical protein
VAGPCEHGNETTGSTKGEEPSDQPSYHQHLKTDPALFSYFLSENEVDKWKRIRMMMMMMIPNYKLTGRRIKRRPRGYCNEYSVTDKGKGKVVPVL